jgi:hypothetical protein
MAFLLEPPLRLMMPTATIPNTEKVGFECIPQSIPWPPRGSTFSGAPWLRLHF